MVYHVEDTIAAIASAPGGSARGILRISGPGTLDCLEPGFTPAASIGLRTLRHAQVIAGQLRTVGPVGALPVDLYLWPTARSYTGQVAAEVHTLGSPPLLEAALQAICEHGARLAEPGEFTFRAFLAGRLDLTQAEAVLGVVQAEDGAALRVALSQLAGGLTRPLNRLREQLLDLLAHVEAGLDFVEEDIEFITRDDQLLELDRASSAVRELLEQLAGRSNSNAEPRIVLRGSPNVGKSSLFNALAGADAAITSPQSGTTRDYVTCRVAWEQGHYLLVDTAGVDECAPADRLAAAAQELAHHQSAEADVELLCLDATRPMNGCEREILQRANDAHRIVVLTKVDRGVPGPNSWPDAVSTSSHTGAGLDQLRALISERLQALDISHLQVVASTGERCRESLAIAGASLHRARGAAAQAWGEDLLAAELRHALDAVGQVAGTVYTDDLLDRIFSRFCIGK